MSAWNAPVKLNEMSGKAPKTSRKVSCWLKSIIYDNNFKNFLVLEDKLQLSLLCWSLKY